MAVREEISLAELLDLLSVVEVPGDARRERGGVRVFQGRPQDEPSDRVFGGLLLGQSLMSAAQTTPSGHQPFALHADFLRGVPTDRNLRWEVEQLTDGAAMATRRATLCDHPTGTPYFTALSRWGSVRQDLPSFDAVAPREAPDPDTLLDLEERYADQCEVPLWWRMRRPVRFHHVEAPPYLDPGPPGHNQQTAWVRARGNLPDDIGLRAAVLAYVTDMSILESAFRALGSTRHGPGSRLLSLSHSVVFHEPSDLSTWHQFDSVCHTVAHGRALGTGELFDAARRHVATAVQFALTKFS